MGEVFKYHILPLCMAVILAYLCWNFTPAGDFIQDTARLKYLHKQVNRDDFYSNLVSHPAAWSHMRSTLLDPQGILIMGSSELTNDDSTGVIPYRWLNTYSPFHVLAIGHAGNQALSMLTQLASLDSCVPGSKVVLILSPVWYQGTNAAGTTSELFLEYTNRNILREILQNDQLDPEVKSYLLAYVRKQYAQIVSPSPELKLMRYEGVGVASALENLVYFPLKCYNHLVIRLDEYLRGPDAGPVAFPQPDTLIAPRLPYPNMDSLMQKALRDHAIRSSTNSWGIEDDYYALHIQGAHGTIKHLPETFNTELNDLEMLAAYLEKKKANALFIMQGVNPFYYNHLHQFKPVDVRIQQILQQHHHAYVNMLEYDSTRYVKGMLKDIMHYGTYGWLQLNQEILRHYSPYENQPE